MEKLFHRNPSNELWIWRTLSRLGLGNTITQGVGGGTHRVRIHGKKRIFSERLCFHRLHIYISPSQKRLLYILIARIIILAQLKCIYNKLIMGGRLFIRL
jgi:hypothetical protein